MNNGLEDYYIIKNNKKLRYGYTTGSCSAAAAKAAAVMLLSGSLLSRIDLMTPKGIELHLMVQDIRREPELVSCAVRKDGGDDPDATDGALIYAAVSCIPEPEITIDGGKGVGRVTKPGLSQPVGAAAINTVPRQMIRKELEQVKETFDYAGGFQVIVSVPEGEQIAGKTFNPRLGIVGGISILGTSGIVVPMSEAALIASIRLEMQMLRANGHEYLLITPGNYGENFTREEMTIDLSSSMKCSNYVGETLDMAVELGIKGILFVAHIGKFIKVAGGIMNTHSRHSDARAELMCAFALRAGAGVDTARRILDTVTTEEALDILQETGSMEPAMELAAQKVHYYLQHRVSESIQTEAILFSSQKGFLAQTDGAEALVRKINAENKMRNGEASERTKARKQAVEATYQPKNTSETRTETGMEAGTAARTETRAEKPEIGTRAENQR